MGVLERYRWRKAIKKVIRDLKWPNYRDAIEFEKAHGNHGKYWRRIPQRNLSKFGTYKRRTKYYRPPHKSYGNDWYIDKDGDWVLKLKKR